MKKYKVLKTVTNGSGIDLKDEHFEDGNNSVGYDMFTKRPLRRWRTAMSTSSLEGIAESLASSYLETKKDEQGKYNPFKKSDLDLSFSHEGTKWGDCYGFYFQDTRELTYEERDQLVASIGEKIRDYLKKEKASKE
jgi:hypothetical protein